MASLRLKFSRSRSPRERAIGLYGSIENHNVINEHQGMPSDVLRAGATRQRDERKQYLHAANAEIDELKDGLKYAEFQLTRVTQEKESLEKDKKTHAYQVGDLNMKLR